MATNHLGHFALTGLLLDRIVTTARSRIVTVSSHLHRIGHLRPDDVAGESFRSTWVAYGTSKLANLLFTFELDRRLRASGLPTQALAAHPGWTRSNLAGSGAALGKSRVRRKLARRHRIDVRAIRRGRGAPRPVCGHLLVGALGPVPRSGPPVRSLRPAQAGARVAAGAQRRAGRRAVGGIRRAHRCALLGRRPRLSADSARRTGALRRSGPSGGVPAQEVRVPRRSGRVAARDRRERSPPSGRRPGTARRRHSGTAHRSRRCRRGARLVRRARPLARWRQGRRPPDRAACAPRAAARQDHRHETAGTRPNAPATAPRPRRRRGLRRGRGEPGRGGGSRAPRSRGRPVRAGARAAPHPARGGRWRRGSGRWPRSGAGPRPPATPCTRATPCRAGSAAGTGGPATRRPAGDRDGAPRPGRRSRGAGPRERGRGRRCTPPAPGRARGTGQPAGAEPGAGSGSGRCRRKVPVARLTSIPSESRTVASP